jgi:hypothetical protein
VFVEWVDRKGGRRDAGFLAGVLAVDGRLAPSVRKLRAHAEAVLEHVLPAQFDAIDLGIVAVDRLYDTEQQRRARIAVETADRADIDIVGFYRGDIVTQFLAEDGDDTMLLWL